MAARIKYKLKYPFPEENPTTFELELRRIKGRDLKRVKNIQDDEERGMFMICQLAEISSDEFDEMDAVDITALGKMIAVMTDEDEKKL